MHLIVEISKLDTHYLMIPIAFLQGWGQISILQSSFGGQVIEGSGFGQGNFVSFTSIFEL